MLAITVEFLHGTFRGDPDGTANTGRLVSGEWPPSPSRLFAALVAADGTGERCRVTNGSDLEWFEALPPPIIRADGEPYHHHQWLHPRYVASAPKGTNRGTHQEYVGKKGAKVRPGVRVAPRNPRVVYSWDVEPPTEILQALRQRAARVGYIGTSDSPARLRVLDEMPESSVSLDVFRHDQDGDTVIGVPVRGRLQELDRMYEDALKHGPNINRAQYPALNHPVVYRSPGASGREDVGKVISWMRLEKPLSGRRISSITDLFKKAVLAKYQDNFGEPPPLLHGHGMGQDQYDLARFLALPDVGYRWSRGKVFGLALWVPPKTCAVIAHRAQVAVHAVRCLTGNGVKVDVSATDGKDDKPFAANAGRWTRSARRWATAFPAVHERYGPLTLSEVARWCRNAGLPAPIAFRSTRKPLVSGGVDLAPVEVHRPGKPGKPYSHVEVVFAERVPGPVVIGGGRQRGLGLCVQVV